MFNVKTTTDTATIATFATRKEAETFVQGRYDAECVEVLGDCGCCYVPSYLNYYEIIEVLGEVTYKLTRKEVGGKVRWMAETVIDLGVGSVGTGATAKEAVLDLAKGLKDTYRTGTLRRAA